MSPTIAYLLYGLFALGGVGVYLAMPRPAGGPARAGLVVGMAAIAGLMALIGTQLPLGSSPKVWFHAFAGLAILSAGRVVTHPQPVYSAVYFGLTVVCVALLLVMQQAEFLAAALVIVYAGAILVTYMFVIMLAQQSGVAMADVKAREPLLAVLVSFVTMGAVAGRIADLPMPAAGVAGTEAVATAVLDAPPSDTGGGARSSLERPVGNTLAVGRRLFGPYVVGVELAGVLLLIAMVGAIALARKRTPVEDAGPPPAPLGEVGRTAAPF